MSVRLNLFLKGNLDVCDTLYGQRIPGKANWNGINEVLRAGSRAVTVRVRHETSIGDVPVVRNRTLDYLLHPYELGRWPAADLDWLKSNFMPESAPGAERSIEDLVA